jgi:hypothetical protein
MARRVNTSLKALEQGSQSIQTNSGAANRFNNPFGTITGIDEWVLVRSTFLLR